MGSRVPTRKSWIHRSNTQHLTVPFQKTLYGMQSATRAWHKTMSAFLHTQGCTKVGYEESMATSNGHQILLAANIDDFIISCAHRPTLDDFRDALLSHFDGTTDGAIQTYVGCEIERDMSTGTTTLSQKHFAEDILRTYGFWGSLSLVTMLPPHHVVESLLDPLRGSGWIGNRVLLVYSPPDRDTTVAWGVFFMGGFSK